MDNLKEMDTLLQKYNLPKLNQEETEIMNTQITNTKIKTVVKKIYQQQKPRARCLHR